VLAAGVDGSNGISAWRARRGAACDSTIAWYRGSSMVRQVRLDKMVTVGVERGVMALRAMTTRRVGALRCRSVAGEEKGG
jgi:hypothetical protein